MQINSKVKKLLNNIYEYFWIVLLMISAFLIFLVLLHSYYAFFVLTIATGCFTAFGLNVYKKI